MFELIFAKNSSVLMSKELDNVVYYPFQTTIKIYNHSVICETICESQFKHINQEKDADTLIDTFAYENIYIYRYIVKIGELFKSFAKVVNKSEHKIKVCYLTSLVISGIFGEIKDSSKCLVKYYRSGWCAEGNVCVESLDDLHLPIVNDRDSQTYHDFVSETSYTTKTYFPEFFFENQENGSCAFIMLEPKGRWQVRLAYDRAEYSDLKTLSVKTYTGNLSQCDFYINLEKDEHYETIVTVFGKANSLNECVRGIYNYKRSKRQANNYVIFNDYLNCLWAKPNSGNTIPLVNKCAELGVDIYCMDSGWYKLTNETDWFGTLGDWRENDDLFIGHKFSGIINYVRSKGMIFGMWFELEVCTTNSLVSKNDESWFLHQDGERIFESGRYFLDLRNEDVRKYLVNRVKYFYDLGIRYIKNDYNATFFGCDSKKGGKIYGLEQHAECVALLYDEIKIACPGIIIENCASGGMRCDEFILGHADLTSISDCENYTNYPGIIKGCLANVLPEQLGIWTNVYPSKVLDKYKSYPSEEVKNRLKDGEETVFNIISSFMGTMYLSGRIDKADQYNFSLLKQGIDLHKEVMREIVNSYPLLDTTRNNFYKKEGVVTQELEFRNKCLIAVWYLDSGETTYVVNGKNVRVVYPVDAAMNSGVIQQNSSSQITVRFNKKNQARLFEITK